MFDVRSSGRRQSIIIVDSQAGIKRRQIIIIISVDSQTGTFDARGRRRAKVDHAWTFFYAAANVEICG